MRRREDRIEAAQGAEALHYDRTFLSPADRAELVSWLSTLHPLWENRHSDSRPMRAGQKHRRLLRPVYWLGHWQFACLGYYKPPHALFDRCVRAEPFPSVLQRLVGQIEARARSMFSGEAMPERWALNTCLVNFYGLRRKAEKWVDTARVGEHKDFEPGPVASLSLGEAALFQFVESETATQVLAQEWLDDGSLQIFGGARWKDDAFHRVQRVERRGKYHFDFAVEDFKTRRVNFTFRYVPVEYGVRFAELSPRARRDIAGYVETLAQHSPFFADQLRQLPESGDRSAVGPQGDVVI